MMATEGRSIAARLRALRASAGLTQQELAGKAGLSMSVVTQIERGVIPDPRISTLRALAQALNITVGELVDTPLEG
jgi:transcriptional regulator with XRE-family HTH domain